MAQTKYPRPTDPQHPTTGQRCGCRPGVWRDNCPTCEGTGWVIDFAAIRARWTAQQTTAAFNQEAARRQALANCEEV